LNQIDRGEQERESEVQPQTLPPWGGGLSGASLLYDISTRDRYDF
jgi:hypothetical protein